MRAMLAMLGVLLLAAAKPTLAADKAIGLVFQELYTGARGTPPARAERQLVFRTKVFSDELVRTGPESSTALAFLDETRLQVGPNSSLRLDRFVYDPDQRTGALAVELGKGIFRFVTGKIRKEAILVRTPSAAITVRGTRFIAQILADDGTVVWVVDGLLAVKACDGQTWTAGQGQSVIVAGDCSASFLVSGRRVESSLATDTDLALDPALFPKRETWRLGEPGRRNRARGNKERSDGIDGRGNDGIDGRNGGLACLLPESLVVMVDGSARRLDRLRIGDRVRALDAATGRRSDTVVTAIVSRHPRDSLYSINGSLFVTNDHPVAIGTVDGPAWRRVDELESGDRIVASGGDIVVDEIAAVLVPVETVYVETQAGTMFVRTGRGDYLVGAGYAAGSVIESAALLQDEPRAAGSRR